MQENTMLFQYCICFATRIKLQVHNRFLNWLLGPADHMCNAVMFSLSSCLQSCSRNTITTAKVQPTLCQRAAIKTDFLFVPVSWLNLVLPESGIIFSKVNLQNSCAAICFYLFLQRYVEITLLLLNRKCCRNDGTINVMAS